MVESTPDLHKKLKYSNYNYTVQEINQEWLYPTKHYTIQANLVHQENMARQAQGYKEIYSDSRLPS